MDPELKNILLMTNPFKYLVIDEIDMLVKYSKMVTFADGEVLLRQGKKCDRMYIIIKGKAIVTARILGKDFITFATIEDGNFIGEVNLIEKIPCIASVIANGEMECLQLTATYFDMLYLFFPEIHYKITKAITEEVVLRIKHLYDKITEYIKKSPMEESTLKSTLKLEAIHFKDVQIDEHGLRCSNFFNYFNQSEYDELLSAMILIKAESHATIINKDDENTPYFLVLRGAVQSSIIANHVTAKLSVLGPMSFFGSISLIDNSPSIITYTTCERCVLLAIKPAQMLRLQNNIQLWHKLYYAICMSFIAIERAADKLLIRLNSESYNR